MLLHSGHDRGIVSSLANRETRVDAAKVTFTLHIVHCGNYNHTPRRREILAEAERDINLRHK